MCYRSVMLLIQPEKQGAGLVNQKARLCPEGILYTHQLAGGGAKMQWAREVSLDLLLNNFARACKVLNRREAF